MADPQVQRPMWPGARFEDPNNPQRGSSWFTDLLSSVFTPDRSRGNWFDVGLRANSIDPLTNEPMIPTNTQAGTGPSTSSIGSVLPPSVTDAVSQITGTQQPDVPIGLRADQEFARRAAQALQRGRKPQDARFSGMTMDQIRERAGLPKLTTAQAIAESTSNRSNLGIDAPEFDDSWIATVPSTFVQQSLENNDGPTIARLILKGNGYAEDSQFGQWFINSIGNQLIDSYARDAALDPGQYVTDYTGILEYGQGMFEHYLTPGGNPEVAAARGQQQQQGQAVINQAFNNPTSEIAQAMITQMATAENNPDPRVYNPADVLFQRLFQPTLTGATATAQQVMQAQLDNAYRDYYIQSGLGYGGTFLDYVRDKTNILASYR